MTIACAVAVWLLFPIRYVAGVAVEDVRVADAGDGHADRSREGGMPRRIVVTFSAPSDLAALRERIDAGFITAALFDCADSDAANRLVVTQRAGYLPDEGRVEALGPAAPGGPHRYRASFDDRLSLLVDHRDEFRPAIGTPGGLCFALRGGSMWFGLVWSATLPLDAASR